MPRNAHTNVFLKGKDAALRGLERDARIDGYSLEGRGSGFARSWERGYDSVPAKKRGSKKVEGGVPKELSS